MNYAYYSIMHIIREVYFGWCLRYTHSSGASFIFIFIFLHMGRALYYISYLYIDNTWITGIIKKSTFNIGYKGLDSTLLKFYRCGWDYMNLSY